MRHPSWLLRSILLLLLGGGAVACYEPVDLVSPEELLVPCVHCILNFSDTQYLSMHYLTKDNAPGRGIDEAEVTFYEYYPLSKEQGTKVAREYSFENLGNGLWRMIFPPRRPIDEEAPCKLQIVLPSGDTLRAETTMVSDSRYEWDIDYDQGVIGKRKAPNFEEYFPNGSGWSSHNEVNLHGEDIIILPDDSRQLHRPQFVLYPSAGTVWIYKIGWSKEEEDWFLEKELATDREDLVDGFNRTGKYFVQSKDPLAMETYPSVVGNPLHYCYLRIPNRGTTDTISISGDFSGRHYGVGGAFADILPMYEEYIIIKQMIEYMKQGLPYEEPPCLFNGKVGKVVIKRVSKEYDLYLKDVAEYHLLHDVGTDIIAIYDNTNIYSNIDGGIGIFGAESEVSYYWSCGSWNL